MPDDTQNPDPTAVATGEAAATTGEQTDWRAKAEEWQNRFRGLQGTFQREQTRLTEAQAQLLDLGNRLTGLTGEKEALALELDKYKGQAASIQTERDSLMGQVERLSILTEFPALMPLEKKGLLPTGAGGANSAASPDGGTPPGPSPVKKDRAALMAEVRRYQAEGKRAEYDQAYAALLALDAK
jgi:TolA-binding protein